MAATMYTWMLDQTLGYKSENYSSLASIQEQVPLQSSKRPSESYSCQYLSINHYIINELNLHVELNSSVLGMFCSELIAKC